MQKKLRSGFSLVELLVVIGIMTAITTALVIRQNQWSDKLALNTQIYELALMLRQAQIYSLGVKQNIGTTGDPFNVGYGVCVDTSTTGSYIFFVDNDNDGRCGTGETLETKTLTRGVRIEKICATDTDGEVCSTSNSSIRSLHVSFLRPNPQALMQMRNPSGGPSIPVSPPAAIYLIAPGGAHSQVLISSSGQISIVENPL